MNINKTRIIVGIATQDHRKNTFERTINSLLNQTVQADKIYVYNNDDETNDNHGANSKYYPLEVEQDDFYFFTVDDDIEYPIDYIETMIKYIDDYDKKYVITNHGRILTGLNKHYYSGHISFSFKSQTYNMFIDVAGTGVTAYHTSVFKDKTKNSFMYLEPKRMVDLLFSLECAKQDIPIMLIEHKQGWIKNISEDYIYAISVTEYNNDNRMFMANDIYNIKMNKNHK